MQDGKHVILAIDDNDDFLNAVKMTLESAGYLIVTAKSGEEGLIRYKEKNPDLVIVDLMMEEVDAGVNFVKELKLLGSKIPVFLLSGAGDSMASNIDYTQLGFSGVFQKPVNGDQILKVIKAKLAE